MSVDEQIKEQLARELCAIFAGWTVTEVIARFRIHGSRISELRSGKLKGFSIGRLIRLIAMHDYDVELQLRPTKRQIVRAQGPVGRVVRYDRFDRPL